VLHDLNQAARYATHLIAMRDGRIEAQGPPGEIITAELVERVFGVRCRIIEDPESGTPLVVPAARRPTRGPDAAAGAGAGNPGGDVGEGLGQAPAGTAGEAAADVATEGTAAAARPEGSPAP